MTRKKAGALLVAAYLAIHVVAAVPGPIQGKDYKIDASGHVVEMGEAGLAARMWGIIVGRDTIVSNTSEIAEEGQLNLIGQARHELANFIRFFTHFFLGENDTNGNRIAGSSSIERGAAFVARAWGGGD